MKKLIFSAVLVSTLFAFIATVYALPITYDPDDIKMGKKGDEPTIVEYTFSGIEGDIVDAVLSVYLKSAESAKIKYYIDGDRMSVSRVSGDTVLTHNVTPYLDDGLVSWKLNLKSGSLYVDKATLSGSTGSAGAHAPIPTSILLLVSGLIGLVGFRRMHKE